MGDWREDRDLDSWEIEEKTEIWIVGRLTRRQRSWIVGRLERRQRSGERSVVWVVGRLSGRIGVFTVMTCREGRDVDWSLDKEIGSYQ